MQPALHYRWRKEIARVERSHEPHVGLLVGCQARVELMSKHERKALLLALEKNTVADCEGIDANSRTSAPSWRNSPPTSRSSPT